MLRDWFDRLRSAGAARLADEDGAVTRTVRGVLVVVVNSRPDIDTEDVFRRADAVLALVERWQPWRFRHLRRDIAGILVQRFPCRGAYLPDRRAVLLELTFMVNPSFNDAQVASTLVHEGVHARIERMAERLALHGWRADPARHERICRRAELDFGLVVPGGEPVVQRALAAMQLDDAEVAPDIDWTEARRRVQAVDDGASEDRV